MTVFFQTEIEKASKLGFAEGSKGLPSPEALNPDLNESKFYAKVISLLNKTVASISPKIAALTKKVTEAGAKLEVVSATIDSLKNRTSLEAQIDSRLKQSFSSMVEAKKNQLLREAELSAFKLSYNLYHPAHYPEDMARHMSWVVFALAIETAINAAFFAGASGLVVGAIIALTVAGVNLGIAFIGGWFFREKNSVHGSQKIQAWLIFLFCWVLITTLNLLTAAYRSASAELLSRNLGEDPLAAILQQEGKAFGQALTNVAGILDGRFPFSDLNGLILLFVGLLAAVIGMWKGYGADDPYPKYGEITRLAIAASKIYNELEQALKSDAQTVADQPLRQIVDARQAINSIKQQIGAARMEATNLKSEWRQKFTELQHEYQSIIEVYRKAVRSVKPNPVPLYFDEPVGLNDQQHLDENLEELENQTNQMQIRINEASAQDLPFLADSEQTINNERSTLLGNVVVNHITHITQTARDSI